LSAYPHIIAHRCGGALAPENSLPGLAIAARLGCKGVEFDVMLTADRVPILMHDETLERTTTGRGRVAEETLAQIRRYDTGTLRHPAFAAGAVLPVPTFAEALDLCMRLGLWTNIEIKPAAGHEEETGAVVGAWLAAHWDGHGVVSSFSEKSALAARRALPAAPFAVLCTSLPDDWQERCARIGAVAVHLAGRQITPAQAAALQAAGMAWAAYTINERADAERLFALGCAAIFTDRPDRWQPEEM
jgi:glycerophosphoryl diester phosphodiesterase